jgi:hypothetical protein
MKTLLDGDKLNLVGLRPVGNIAMAVADAVQDYKKEEQVVGAAAFFILLCKTFRIEPGEAFRIADRVIRSANAERPELIAAEHYMRENLQ